MAATNPFHVFIIPDGNRRWAERLRKHPREGHRAGYETFKKVLESIWNYDVTHFTFWALQPANREKREPEQIRQLNKLLDAGVTELLSSPRLHEKGINFRAIGNWLREVPKDTQEKIVQLQTETARYTKPIFTLLLDYDGKWELVETFNRMRGSFTRRSFDEIKMAAPTSYLPPVDLLIRTGEMMRISGAPLPYQMIDPELEFPKCMWPDFNETELHDAIAEFYSRKRRFGA